MATSSSLAGEKTRWWLTDRKLVRRYLRDARSLVATRELPKVSTAVGLLDAALALSPSHEAALELKARSLLFLHRFREVVDMLRDYIPSGKMAAAAGDNDSSTSLCSAASAPLNRELLSPGREGSGGCLFFRCFSVSDLKRKFLAGLSKSSGDEGHWRYVYRSDEMHL
ncbi:DNAJ heat shock N-terminal domain-containing protein [Musa troglodytarum]|uniref:DNAJ heat shock N-terminal domain-containing protein n=1 Tax=Musa troglodytarum TaxID=320322 RepID=A0A9E7EDL9_9LILI|nr:DNAJ heat shock N-terminal domain-containing protein [Musa troglodytarum]